MAISSLTLKLASVVAKDRQQSTIKPVLQERTVEKPMPAVTCVFHQHKKTGEHCKYEDSESCDY